jgi:hypothetical protein
MNRYTSFNPLILNNFSYFFSFDFQTLDLHHHMNFHTPLLLPMNNIKPNSIIYFIHFYIQFNLILWLKYYFHPKEIIALISMFFSWILSHLACPFHFKNIHHLLNWFLFNLVIVSMVSIDEILLSLYLILNYHHFADSFANFYLHYHFDHNWIKSLLHLQSHNHLIPSKNLHNCLATDYFLQILHNSQFSAYSNWHLFKHFNGLISWRLVIISTMIKLAVSIPLLVYFSAIYWYFDLQNFTIKHTSIHFECIALRALN